MTIEQRQAIEKRIVTRLVEDALKAGYTLWVDDGEDETCQGPVADDTVTLLMDLDEARLRLRKNGSYAGEVKLVFGNDGYDVISDYNVAIEEVLKGTEELATAIEEGKA